MEDPSFAATLAARIEADPDMSKTLVERPSATIEPHPPSSGAMAALHALRALGATLGGRIDLHATLGEGGMGIVHLATQATLGRHVAVKTLRSGVSGADPSIRILREAWVTGALEHPNIVPVHDVGVDAAGSPVIVMKRIEGLAWSDLIHDPGEVVRRFAVTDPLEWNLRTLVSVCNAVHFAHSRGILHRDLKPENVMIGQFGEVYVVDWGIAVSLRDDPSGRLPPASQAKEIAGTPNYMAPEMLLGDPTMLSPRTDVYLLGAIFYEIIAGEPPHHGDNLRAMMADILLSAPAFSAKFPVEARHICARALARDPADRQESAEELRLAIEEYLRHRGSRKLAHDAKQSLVRLEEAIKSDARGPERELAIANLLGECRFGYHAALSAWPDNATARRGLDEALLLVVEHELAEGDAAAGATLLRDVSAPPPSIASRVEAAVKARAAEEERLRRIEEDLDPRVGSRTRSFLSGIFGIAWTMSPLLGWWHVLRAERVPYFATAILPSIVYLGLGGIAFLWARETLTKTLLNRRLAMTVGLYLISQMILGFGGWLAGISSIQIHLMFLFAWALMHTLLAVWAERWFALPAAVCGLGFVVAAAFPTLVYPLMSLGNLVLTIVLVKVWLPRQDLALIQERRRELRRRARRWLRPMDHG
jgi:eukaryotic-like serine/threonine-protein kinase